MFDKNEINVLVTSLNNLQIKGSDAAYIYSIQVKLNEELEKIKKEELKREEDLKSGPPELQDNKVEQKITKKS
tara:strand:+ start:1786 stop:2004 length:219 start_codon:yes stop_codon:yes gene_type:complete